MDSWNKLEELVNTTGPQWLRDAIAGHMTPAEDETPEEADTFQVAFDRVYDEVCEVAASPLAPSYLGGWGPTPEQIKGCKRDKRVMRALLKQAGMLDTY